MKTYLTIHSITALRDGAVVSIPPKSKFDFTAEEAADLLRLGAIEEIAADEPVAEPVAAPARKSRGGNKKDQAPAAGEGAADPAPAEGGEPAAAGEGGEDAENFG